MDINAICQYSRAFARISSVRTRVVSRIRSTSDFSRCLWDFDFNGWLFCRSWGRFPFLLSAILVRLDNAEFLRPNAALIIDASSACSLFAAEFNDAVEFVLHVLVNWLFLRFVDALGLFVGRTVMERFRLFSSDVAGRFGKEGLPLFLILSRSKLSKEVMVSRFEGGSSDSLSLIVKQGQSFVVGFVWFEGFVFC